MTLIAVKLRGTLHYQEVDNIWHVARRPAFCGEPFHIIDVLSVSSHYLERTYGTPQCETCRQYIIDHPEIGALP